MARKRPSRISLTRRERKILEKLSKGRKCARFLSDRAQILLYWSKGRGVRETARDMDIHPKTVLRWRQRWITAVDSWGTAPEEWLHRDLERKIREALSDAARSGAPPKFTPEQVCEVIRIACKLPSTLGVPVSHWSAADLRREVLRQNIFLEISVSSIGRFLKRPTSSPTACAIG